MRVGKKSEQIDNLNEFVIFIMIKINDFMGRQKLCAHDSSNPSL